jgi:hypothetical protein
MKIQTMCKRLFFSGDLSTAGQRDYHESPNFHEALLGEASFDGAPSALIAGDFKICAEPVNRLR